MTRRKYDFRSGELVDDLEDEVVPDQPNQRPHSEHDCCPDGWTRDHTGTRVPCLVCCRAGPAAARHALHQAKEMSNR